MAWLSTLTALAQTEGYDPSNPPLPNFPTTDSDTTHYYTLRVVSSPATSGLNTTGGNKYTAGQSVYLSASQNNGMKFQYWLTARAKPSPPQPVSTTPCPHTM